MSKPKKEVADLTWREAIAKQKGYVEWVVENYRNISDQQRATLAAALDPTKNSGGNGASSTADPAKEPIDKKQIVELRNLGKELGAEEAVERFIERKPSMEKAAHEIAKAKVQLAKKREQEEAEEKEQTAAAGQPQDDEERVPGEDDEEEESGSLFAEDDDLPFD